MLKLAELIELQRSFDSRHKGAFDWDTPINEETLNVLEYLLVATLGELGECANIAKKVRRGDLTFSAALPELSEEVIDVLIYVVKLTYQLGIDVDDVYRKKLARNEDRFLKYEATPNTPWKSK